MCSGDAFWLQPRDWKTFLDYEADLNSLIADEPVTLLCTYPLSVSKAGDLLDVARAHQVTLEAFLGSYQSLGTARIFSHGRRETR